MRKMVLAALAATMLAGPAPAAVVFVLNPGSTVTIDYGPVNNGAASISGTATGTAFFQTSLNFFTAGGEGAGTLSTFNTSSPTGASFGGSASFNNAATATVVFSTYNFGPQTPILINYTGPGTIQGAAAPVPEPASWAMMLAGFGVIGTAMRRRRTAVRFA